jgi:hypothetical protein
VRLDGEGMRPCTSCTDSRRGELDAALVRGDSYRNIAERFGTSLAGLSRHRPHIGKALIKAAERKGEHYETVLLRKVERLEADARRLGKRAEAEGDLRAALVAVDKLMNVVSLQREMTKPRETSEADAERVLVWYAEEAGVSVDEMRAECEKFARTRDDICAGRHVPHSAPPAPQPSYRASVLPEEPKPAETPKTSEAVPVPEAEPTPPPRWKMTI